MPELMWKIAIIIDVLHIVVVVPMILLAGRGKIFGKNMGPAFVLCVLGLQTAFLECPLTVLTGWMRSFKEPSYDPYATSFVHRLYTYLGPFGALHWVLSACCFVLAGLLVRTAYRRKYTTSAISA